MEKTLYQRAHGSVKALAVAGLVGLTYVGCEFLELPPTRDVTREEFNKNLGAVYLTNPLKDRPLELSLGHAYYIYDINSDGQSDVIALNMQAIFVAEGYKSFSNKRFAFLVDEATKVMTPEIIDAATKALKADQDLSYLIAKENYRLSEQAKQKK